ncbi:MAG TPA: PhoH family protein [Sphingobacteriaceae bacterium]|nr:PhoH family protein [Sphingobacteriaceae bacterium]
MRRIKTPSKMNRKSKIFVIDTSVILYDHNALNNFKEHDVAIPIQVLEELDNHKSGNETRNMEARNFIRLMDEISRDQLINQWIPIPGGKKGNFKVILATVPQTHDAVAIFRSDKFDHEIINAALILTEEHPDRKVVLVSKDICLRLKAQSLGLTAEDYQTGKIANVADLYTGQVIRKDFPEALFKQLKDKQPVTISVGTLELEHQGANLFYVLKRARQTVLAAYSRERQIMSPVSTAPVFGIKPKNPEQAFALSALLNPDIKLVTIQGNAGTGKTLLALASALQQRKDYRQIYITRPVIPLSNREIGFLPGDAKTKTDPFLAPIWDNLKFIKEQLASDQALVQKIDELVANEKIAITPLAFIRGRTLTKIFFIVDEAQNLTPHEIKTIISRAGEHTKIVFTGDIYQIDTPYLDAESNGLSYLIEHAKHHPLCAHITLQKGERSTLANLANTLL